MLRRPWAPFATRTRYSKVRSQCSKPQMSALALSPIKREIADLSRGRIALKVIVNVVAGMIFLRPRPKALRCAGLLARGDIHFVPRSDEGAI